MNTKQIKEYLKETTIFKLKDFNKTNDKYKDYKNDKFSSLLEYNQKEEVEDFENMFSYQYNYYTYELMNKLNTKSNIRAFSTIINSIIYKVIETYIEFMSDWNLNDNEIKSFTIKYYLKYYEKINKAMYNILKETILGAE